VIINNYQLFNIGLHQRENYLVTDELKCHNFMLKISAFLFDTSVDLHESPTTFSCCNIISRQWWSNSIWFMNKKLFNVKLSFKFHHIIHNTTVSMHQQVPCTSKKMISWAHSLLRAVTRSNFSQTNVTSVIIGDFCQWGGVEEGK